MRTLNINLSFVEGLEQCAVCVMLCRDNMLWRIRDLKSYTCFFRLLSKMPFFDCELVSQSYKPLFLVPHSSIPLFLWTFFPISKWTIISIFKLDFHFLIGYSFSYWIFVFELDFFFIRISQFSIFVISLISFQF